MNPVVSARRVAISDDHFADYPMDALTEDERGELSRLFAVDSHRIEETPHPIDPNILLVSIRFFRGINIASALAAFLNQEIYQIPTPVDPNKLIYLTSRFAYVDDREYGRTLHLTLPENRAAFIRALNGRAEDIRFVIKNPEILFMMRPHIDYKTARLNLQNGYRPAI